MPNNENQLKNNEPNQKDNFLLNAGKYLLDTAWEELIDPIFHFSLSKLKTLIINKIGPDAS